jgi:hypothetical protein
MVVGMFLVWTVGGHIPSDAWSWMTGNPLRKWIMLVMRILGLFYVSYLRDLQKYSSDYYTVFTGTVASYLHFISCK